VKHRAASTWAVTQLAVCLGANAAAVWLGFRRPPGLPALSAGDVFFGVAILSFPLAAAVIIARRPANAVGWLLAATGVMYAAGVLAWEIGVQGYFRLGPREAAAEVWLAWFGSWATIAAPSALLVALLHFPDGRPAARRLALVTPGVVLLGTVVTVAHALIPGRLNASGPLNPVGSGAAQVVVEGVDRGSVLLLLVVVGAVITTLVIRFRRSDSAVQRQIKWLLLGTALLPVGIAVGTVLNSGATAGSPRDVAASALFAAGVIAVPAAIAIAMVRHRLYDVDLLISRGLVYLALAVGITAVYVAGVVALGSLIGWPSSSLPLSILATVLIALAFQPARLRLQRLANRIVYGRRTSPNEALSRFVRRVALTYDWSLLLQEMATAVGEGTAAAAVEVWTAGETGERVAARWPKDAPSAGAPPASPEWHVEAIEHRGERLGAIAVKVPPGETLSRADTRLIHDLALHAGLAVRNYRLSSELVRRLVELAASRHRLVNAQEAERRRLVRDLHDGAQQHLIALRLNLLALAAAPPRRGGPEDARRLVDQADAALAALRALASGIHPAVLSDRGLLAALRTAAWGAPIPVEVQAYELGRYAPEIEATVYFCCIEALQNVYKHSGASSADVTLGEQSKRLVFRVIDDGRGTAADQAGRGSGLLNMSDRVDAFGGQVQIRSAEGGGTLVEGWVPVAEPAAGLRQE
jgi:signal transduction histidine kinase